GIDHAPCQSSLFFARYDHSMACDDSQVAATLTRFRRFTISRKLTTTIRRENPMNTTPGEPLCADPRRLLLEMARERSLPNLLRLAVDRLAESPRVALARIWLVQPTAECTGCPMPAECRNRSTCLHLVASNGRSAVDPGQTWTRLDGAFRRFPLG